MTENETWREVPGYPGYLASSNQQVKRAATNSASGGYRLKERLLVPFNYHDRPGAAKSNGPYVRVTQNGKSKTATLADLMAAAFVCEDYNPQTHTIYFNDHNPQNCAPHNLHVVTRH